MLNALTIDLEDYYQVSSFEGVVKRDDWDKYESRIEYNTYRILQILDSVCPSPHGEDLSCGLTSSPAASRLAPNGSIKATFFCLGWVAERYPELILEICQQGHEIACHGYEHKLIYTQSRDEFREDIRKAKAILEDITGGEILGYRAPSYSITKKSSWSFEILAEEGFKYDSSIFPIHHDRYGLSNAPRFPFLISLKGNSNAEFKMLNYEFNNSVTDNINTRQLKSYAFNTLLEFPLSTMRLLGQNLPISGGGYFRLFPYSFIKKVLMRINNRERKPFIFYIHPWEFDVDQPRFKNGSRLSKFRQYVNLHKTEEKFKNLLKDFSFSSVKEVLCNY